MEYVKGTPTFTCNGGCKQDYCSGLHHYNWLLILSFTAFLCQFHTVLAGKEKKKRKLALTQVNFFLSSPTELPQAQVMHCLGGTGQPRQPSSLPTKSLEMWGTSWPHPPRITLLPSCDHAVHQTLTHTSQSPHCVQPREAAPMINACFPEAGGCAVIAVGALEMRPSSVIHIRSLS